jgi:uncharacterized protein (DUF302 family)
MLVRMLTAGHYQGFIHKHQRVIICSLLQGFTPVNPSREFMSYYFSKAVDGTFDDVIERVTAALAQAGFGVLTTIDVSATLKKKIDADLQRYTILGACNPGFAYKALQAEDKIGVMLPCNVIVQELSDGSIEVAAVDPVASMMAIENPALADIAAEIQSMLKNVIAGL